jgi:hypothetical protein
VEVAHAAGAAFGARADLCLLRAVRTGKGRPSWEERPFSVTQAIPNAA